MFNRNYWTFKDYDLVCECDKYEGLVCKIQEKNPVTVIVTDRTNGTRIYDIFTRGGAKISLNL